MGLLLSLPINRQRRALVDELEGLLQQARKGELVSLLYLAEGEDLKYSYGLVGDYIDSPERAFVPATKCMYQLSVYIEKTGRSLDI